MNSNVPLLRLGTSSELPMQASKWHKCQLLVDADELQALFNELGEIYIYQISGIIKPGEGGISQESFLGIYRNYIDSLKMGKLPSDNTYKQVFTSVITANPEALYAIEVGPEQHLVRISRPVIQMQAHRMDYSSVDGKFRPMVLSSDSILWGLQFSYPQLFENPMTSLVEQIGDTPDFPNTKLFKKLQRWVRHHTAPTPFIVDETKVNIPIRLGKQCFSWINNHPQLQKKGLAVG